MNLAQSDLLAASVGLVADIANQADERDEQGEQSPDQNGVAHLAVVGILGADFGGIRLHLKFLAFLGELLDGIFRQSDNNRYG